MKFGYTHRGTISDFSGPTTERRAGELLTAMEKAQGKRTDLVTRCDQVADDKPTLADLGISKMQSSRWQLEASLQRKCLSSV